MRNYDAWIFGVGIVMFILGWIAASINHNSRIRELKAQIEEIKGKSNEHYHSGWRDGWDSLAVNPDAMRRELTRMDNMRSVPRHKTD